MQVLLLIPLLLSQAAPATDERAQIDYFRNEYLADATKYQFHHDQERRHPLAMVEKPIMRWASDNDWSGDVFVWTHDGIPEVIGCILSGPRETSRIVYHEFHLLASQPIPAVDLQTKLRWQPKAGIARTPVPGAAEPGTTPTARLAQMRRMMREFTAHMEASGTWELRALPQPLYRYGNEKSDIIDGGLFAYVWTTGTDPEFVLLLECLESKGKRAWHYAPIRFSNRQLWLKHDGQEVWRAESHREPGGNSSDLPYTTAYARSFSQTVPETAPAPPTP